MHRKTGLMTTLAITAVLSFSFVGYRSTEAAAPAATGHAVVKNVAIQNFAFSPATLTIAKGTTIKWTNKDSTAHTVTSDTSAWHDSGSLAQGASFSFTFNKVGTFAYHCSIHPFMTAKIIVKAPAKAVHAGGH